MRARHQAPLERRWNRSLVLALLTAAPFAGCSEPSHTAQFGMVNSEAMLLTVDGERPTVALEPAFGPIVDPRWTHDQGVTTFSGVSAGDGLL